jgi:striatin 1/3/4
MHLLRRSKYLSLTQQQSNVASGIPPTKEKAIKEDRPTSPSLSASSDEKESGPQVQIAITPASLPTQTQSQSQSQATRETVSAIPAHLLIRPSSAMSNGIPLDVKSNADKDKLSEKGGTSPFAGGQTTWNPAIGRDPRGRARSRDYLKQCVLLKICRVHALNQVRTDACKRSPT